MINVIYGDFCYRWFTSLSYPTLFEVFCLQHKSTPNCDFRSEFIPPDSAEDILMSPGSSCSKLTTSLVNDSLKFTLGDTQIR